MSILLILLAFQAALPLTFGLPLCENSFNSTNRLGKRAGQSLPVQNTCGTPVTIVGPFDKPLYTIPANDYKIFNVNTNLGSGSVYAFTSDRTIDVSGTCADARTLTLSCRASPVNPPVADRDKWVVRDILVFDLGVSGVSPPSDYTGVKVERDPSGDDLRNVPNFSGQGLSTSNMDLVGSAGDRNVGIYVKYEPLENGVLWVEDGRMIVTDVQVYGVVCPAGYDPANGSIGGVAGGVVVGDNGSCQQRIICVQKKAISDLSRGDLYVQTVSAIKHGDPLMKSWNTNTDTAWVFTTDLHERCGDTFFYRLALKRRARPDIRVEYPNEGSEERMRNLIKQYAPRGWIYSKEDYYPASMAFELQNTLRVWDDNGKFWYLTPKVDDKFRTGEKDLTRDPVYAFWNQRNDYTVDIFYWFFYPYNKKDSILGDHAGDWEHITVRLVDGIPARLYLAQHESGYEYAWNTVSFMDGTHPIVYIAPGSHATYLWPGTHPLFGGIANDETDEGEAWDTWNFFEAFRWDGQKLLPVAGNQENGQTPGWLKEGGQNFSATNTVYKFGWTTKSPVGPIDKKLFGAGFKDTDEFGD
ncbi:hypothetical protein BJ742DRAFT_865357 [Cladochytrium replicatum]|nr:hypothetical protein BJ742DRAFT_865357 [Cladochytrium replicatum]